MAELHNIKNYVAIELGYKSNTLFSAYEQFLINPHGLTYKVINKSVDKIAIRYAQEQNKELVEMLIKCEKVISELDIATDDIKQLIKEATEL